MHQMNHVRQFNRKEEIYIDSDKNIYFIVKLILLSLYMKLILGPQKHQRQRR